MNDKIKKFILSLARGAIASKFNSEDFVPVSVPYELKENGCCFVTLTIDGDLRGCIGHLEAFEPLYKNVIDNAVNAAFRDSRFEPLSHSEFVRVKIEVSVLSSPRRLVYLNSEDLLNKLSSNMGVILKKDFYQSTFLPQVWEMIPDKVEFLQNLSLKAGLRSDSWRDNPEIFVYGVEKICE